MRIALVRLNYRGFPIPPPDLPLALLSLASYIRSRDIGIEVDVIDLNVQNEEALWGNLESYSILGINMMSFVRSQGFRILEKAKQLKPEIKTVVGGYHASAVSELLIKLPYIDAVVVGEGEEILCKLLTDWKDGVHKAEGLLDLDGLPYPAYDLADFDSFDMQIAKARPDWMVNGVRIGDARWSPILASRGCSGRCVFCMTPKHWNYKYRFNSGDYLLRHVEFLYHQGVRLFSFNDDAFPLSRKQGIDFCQGVIERGLRIAWKCDTRGDVFDRELLELMKEAGCFMIAVGVESGSEKILGRINKQLDLNKVRNAIKLMKEVGIIAYVLLMIGNPGESKETIMETVRFLEEVQPNIYSFVTGVMVLPDTEMNRLNGTSDSFWIQGDGLPYYLKERTMNELTEFANMIRQVPQNY